MAQETTPEVTSAADLAAARELFERHGIGGLLGMEVPNHLTGQLSTVDEALAACPPFAGNVIMLDEVLGDNFATGMTNYLESLHGPKAEEV
jgi:hypothetical protein